MQHTHDCYHCGVNFSCCCDHPSNESGDCGSCPVTPDQEFGNIGAAEASNC